MFKSHKLQLTIDTCLVNIHQKIPSINTLERWQAEGKLKLMGTQRLKDETSRHLKANQKVGSMPNVSEPAVWGVSRWGKSLWVSNYDGPEFIELQVVLFPNKKKPVPLSKPETNDVMHLMAHIHCKSEIFLTNNTRHFINNGRQQSLRDKFGIVVMTPEEAVNYLSEKHGWEK